MKERIANIRITATAVTLAALLLYGCSPAQLKTETLVRNCSFPLVEGGTDSLKMDISIEYPVRNFPSKAVRLMNEAISEEMFGEEFKDKDIEESLKDYQLAAVADYREAGQDFLRHFEGGSPVLGWEAIRNGHFLEPYRGIRSYVVYKYDYSGGAHGMDSETGINFDEKTGRRLSGDDIFKEGSGEILGKALSENLRASVSCREDYEILFVKDLEPNGNFTVSPEGITYIYGRYEIGPYVIGITRVTVSWERLEALNILKI